MFGFKKKYTDNELLDLIKQGYSNQALRFLYKNVQPKITNWIKQNNGDEDEAQDIFQDSVLAFYQYVIDGKFREENSIEGFIFSIARNKWINRVKKRNKESLELPKNISVSESYGQNSVFRSKEIEKLLNQLGEVCKELLTYSIFYKMTMEDIAIRMNYSSENAAKTKNYKCKQRLVKIVKDKKNLKDILYRE